MRVALSIALFLLAALAGCLQSPDSPQAPAGDRPIVAVQDVCTLGICLVDGTHMEEVDLQDNAVPLLSFHQDQVASVNGMVRSDAGWALSLRDADGAWQVLLVDEQSMQGRQYLVPSGQTIVEDGLLLRDGVLHITSAPSGATTGPSLHSWDLETGQVTVRSLPDLPAKAHPRGAYNDDVLLIAPRGLLAGDSAVWVLAGDEAMSIGSSGRVMDGAMVTGLLYLVVEEDGVWRVEMQSVDGSFLYVPWSSDNVIGGVWGNDGHVAFNTIVDTSDPAGGRLHELDHLTHVVTRMGNGWDVKFAGSNVIHLTAAEGTSPFVTEWSRSLQDGSEGVFLPDQPIWDATEEGLWWLEAPRTDHRFPETPNPTPFTTLLMTSDR